MALRPNEGQQIGPYLVLERIAQGGQGALFKARHWEMGREVALKVLLDPDPKHVRRFVQEAEVLASLDHPNLPVVHEVGQAGRVPFIAMELVKGETLQAIVERDGLPELAWIKRVLVTVAGVLAHCHKNQVVHRDLKPANILIERTTGRPVLVDFGLVRITGADYTKISLTGDVLGTPSYMAPEQADPEFGEVGTWTDVYGLGAVLYYLLTGKPPFAGSTAYNVILKVMRDPPPDPRAANPSVGQDLARLCQGAMAKTAAVRPPDMEAFAAHLRGAPEEPQPPPAARRGSVLALGVAAGAALLGGLAWWGLRNPPSAPTAPAAGEPDSAAVASASPTASSPADLAARLREAELCLWNDQHAQALRRLTRILGEDPTNVRAWRLRGRVNALLNHSADARRDADRAVALAGGTNPGVYQDRAYVRKSQGDLAGMKEDLRKVDQVAKQVLARNPNDDRARFELAILRGRSWGEKAIRWLEAVIHRNPQFHAAYFHLGRLLSERNAPRRAVGVYARWAVAEPRVQAPWVRRARIHARLKQPGKALDCFAEASRRGPLRLVDIGRRGKCHLRAAARAKNAGAPHLEHWKAAVKDLSALLEASNRLATRRMRGLAYLELGRHEEGIADLIPVLAEAKRKKYPQPTAVAVGLEAAWGAVYQAALKQASYDSALRIGEQLLQAGATVRRLPEDLVDLYNRRTQFSEAVGLVARLIKAGSRNYWVHVHGAHARQRLGEDSLHREDKRRHYLAGIRLLTEAIRIRPKDPRGWNKRSLLFQYVENWRRSAEDCTRWIELRKTSWVAWSRRGWARYKRALQEGGSQRVVRLEQAVKDLERGRRLMSKEPASEVKRQEGRLAEVRAALEKARQ